MQCNSLNVVPWLPASAPPRNLLEMQILKPQPRHTELEKLEVDWMHMKIWESLV